MENAPLTIFRGIHWSPAISPQQPVMWSFDVLFLISLNKLCTKMSSCRWFGTPWRSCEITVGVYGFCSLSQLFCHQHQSWYEHFLLSHIHLDVPENVCGLVSCHIIGDASLIPLISSVPFRHSYLSCCLLAIHLCTNGMLAIIIPPSTWVLPNTQKGALAS